MFGLKKELMAWAYLVWKYNWAKLYFRWHYIILLIIWNTPKLSPSHLSRATSIFVVDCCQFGPSWMFGLKMELMACSGLFGSTTEQSYIFSDLIWYYKWYEIITTCLHHTSSVPQPFLLLIAVNLAQAGFLSWKWSLWPVPSWLVVQRRKAVFFLILYLIINGMK